MTDTSRQQADITIPEEAWDRRRPRLVTESRR
jgi:hypothetical protein